MVWLPMEPAMDSDRLPVGMVAFGSVACRASRTGCLWLGSMYNCNTIFSNIYTYACVYICISVYTYLYVSTQRYMHICIHVQM